MPEVVPVLPSPSFGTTEVEHVLVASLGGYLAVALFELDADEGEQKLESLTRWLERDHPSAVTSPREGLNHIFTINRLSLPSRLRKCLSTTSLIDSAHSGLRQKTRGVVTHWKNGPMALRWAAASFIETEKNYRRIIGYDQLWILKALQPVAEMMKAS